mmetsp:Transcript_15467/g.36787  ORF Transcript_15467/g.36787 Transcript_15467/m.36787 type:complete len:215 (+) Transcript_15467:41-685(+)
MSQMGPELHRALQRSFSFSFLSSRSQDLILVSDRGTEEGGSSTAFGASAFIPHVFLCLAYPSLFLSLTTYPQCSLPSHLSSPYHFSPLPLSAQHVPGTVQLQSCSPLFTFPSIFFQYSLPACLFNCMSVYLPALLCDLVTAVDRNAGDLWPGRFAVCDLQRARKGRDLVLWEESRVKRQEQAWQQICYGECRAAFRLSSRLSHLSPHLPIGFGA